MVIFILINFSNKKTGQEYLTRFFFNKNYSENVNGIVTVVFPDLTLENVQRLTAPLTAVSNSPNPVVEEAIEMLMISPPGAMVNFSVTLPLNPGFFFKNLL